LKIEELKNALQNRKRLSNLHFPIFNLQSSIFNPAPFPLANNAKSL